MSISATGRRSFVFVAFLCLAAGFLAVAMAGEPSAVDRVKSLWYGTEKTPPPAKVFAGEIVAEADKPEEYKKIAAESLYPPCDSPEKLTVEQLDAIAKLAPLSNKAGMRVHPAMVPLFRGMVLNYTGGSYKNAQIRFRLHVPETLQPGKKYPLAVWLHGAGECGVDNVNQLSHLHHIIPYLVGPKKRDFFLLVPQCPHSHVAWEAPGICSTTIRADGSVECHVTDDPVALGDAPISFTLAMIDEVMKRFPVDANRVSVGGLSTGGEGTWKILERRPDLFAAAAPVVSWNAMHEKSLREKPLLKKIPIWAIYSSDDRGIDFARKEFERMRDRGCRVYKTEFGVCGHRAWTPAMLQGDIFGWLISRAKDGQRYYSAESSPTDPEKVGIFADVIEGDLAKKPTKAVAKPKMAEKPVTKPAAPPIPPPLSPPPVVASSPVVTPPTPVSPAPSLQTAIDQCRLQLVARYLALNEIKTALAVADKVKSRPLLVEFLLQRNIQKEVLDYIDREVDRIEQQGAASALATPAVNVPALARPVEKPLKPIAAGKKSPKDECGKEWAMSSTNQYGLFPNGWEQEASHVPAYIVNETGPQLRARLAKAFENNDLAAVKEICESFIRLDDIPLASPWFDTSGGRLQGRIKYTLNEKGQPVVELLREIARVKAESKREMVELARKAAARVEAITNPKAKE